MLLGAIVFLASAAAGTWVLRLDQNIRTRFAEKRFAPPVEFYSAPEYVRAGSTFPSNYFAALFARNNFRPREFGQPIQAGDYSQWTGEQCRSILPVAAPPPISAAPMGINTETTTPTANTADEITRCLAFRNSSTRVVTEVQIIALAESGRIHSVYAGAPPQGIEQLEVEPELFAQYYGDTPILRKVVALGSVPTTCLNALIGIEDAKFLEHPGVSLTGLMRAIFSALKPGTRAVGGSTITQQLVKNYFLTDERTLKRKLTEIPMAFLVERHASKDEILETYINLIYMGQNGPFQVRGFAAASEHYFGKPLGELDLPQCALLAGVLNNPGHLNPFNSPERALKRRAKVLDRMLENNLLDAETAAQAKAAPLPSRPTRNLTEPAPYFVQAVRRDLRARGVDEAEGLRVFTTLNLRAQEAAHQAVRSGLDRLETSYAHLKKLKAQGKNLEAVLVSADPRTGAVQALVGGRGYLVSQFNRATDSHRQVGSVMKPFVYLAAFESLTNDGKPFTPLTQVLDEATTHKYEGQSWTPRNYEGTYNGSVPVFFALKESLNAATANVGVQIGLNNVIDSARRLGVTSNIAPVPSLTLGAFELSPLEVLQSYSALAALGHKTPLSLIWRLETLSGGELYQLLPEPLEVIATDTTSVLVGVMKQTLVSGTGRGARLAGFSHPAAGKTGTTNDKKDAWFAGFTPYHTAVVWVGYDDNTSLNLTGGTGAVPIWTNYMKSYGASFPSEDFVWPEGVEKVELSPEQQQAFGVPTPKGDIRLERLELIFKRGQSPVPAVDPNAGSSLGL
jgi:penicillin-binding protein 1B